MERVLQLKDDRRLRFLIVGGANTVIGFAFYVSLLKLAHLPYMPALVLAWIGATFCAFGLQRRVVFRVRGHVFRDLWRFFSVNIGAFLINAALLPVAVKFVTSDPIVAQLEVAGATMVATYFAHRDFSFHRKKTP